MGILPITDIYWLAFCQAKCTGVAFSFGTERPVCIVTFRLHHRNCLICLRLLKRIDICFIFIQKSWQPMLPCCTDAVYVPWYQSHRLSLSLRINQILGRWQCSISSQFKDSAQSCWAKNFYFFYRLFVVYMAPWFCEHLVDMMKLWYRAVFAEKFVLLLFE